MAAGCMSQVAAGGRKLHAACGLKHGTVYHENFKHRYFKQKFQPVCQR